MLADGTPYQVVKQHENMQQLHNQTDRLIYSTHHLTLPDSGLFESEIFSKASLTTGARGDFRALMAKETLTIGDHSTVWRWAHSDGDMVVGKNVTLNGRVTCRKNMILGLDSNFERLHASKIICIAEIVPSTFPLLAKRTVIETLKGVKSKGIRRSLLEGDLNFPADHEFDGDIVAGSTAIIGDNAYIRGSIKSNALNDLQHYLHHTGAITDRAKGAARCEIGNNVQIDGAVVSTHDLFIGNNCRIFGPVIAENLLVIRSGTVIGSPTRPCTVTANQIIIESGCVIYGTLWAKSKGTVIAAHQYDEAVAV